MSGCQGPGVGAAQEETCVVTKGCPRGPCHDGVGLDRDCGRGNYMR